MLEEVEGTGSEDGDFVEFALAGTGVKGAFHCSECGYGVVVQQTLPRCPMCGGRSWEPEALGQTPNSV